ncbi:aminoacyl-tRNA hydrolase [Neolewinella aurantiaca]|uniref:Aminoacyl-tRNA hydrolase n=1 Tax=Neolewinella aurantiaca TaxID=2602767 RepID=A0A5C7FNL9_9BACT|nr:aminoacyl-tRNA hydrolase [Neolewinella aurantiaca]
MNWPKIREEIELRTSRSSGAGGQHVNKTESRVELVLDLLASEAFSERELKNLRYHLAKQLDANGRISIVDQSGRSQHTNRKRALLRLKEMLERGARPIPKPHKGKAFVANKRKRLDWKKKRGELKASRGKKWI